MLCGIGHAGSMGQFCLIADAPVFPAFRSRPHCITFHIPGVGLMFFARIKIIGL